VSLLALASHILNFVAPAAVVALLVALGARAAMPAVARRGGWGASFAINFVAGLAALGAGLVAFGHDGKMATYAGLVLAVATSQWLASRAWRA
jgi:hypothetical protein